MPPLEFTTIDLIRFGEYLLNKDRQFTVIDDLENYVKDWKDKVAKEDAEFLKSIGFEEQE